MPSTSHSDRRVAELERACRSSIGDRLRTVSLCRGGTTRAVYRRDDLARDADATVREAMTSEDVVVADGGRAVGEFDHGFVAHVRVGETAVVVTTDGLKMDREREVTSAVRGILDDAN